MEFIGAARNVRELKALLMKVEPTATITFSGTDENSSNVELWYDEETNDLTLL